MKKRILSALMILCVALVLSPVIPAQATGSTAADNITGLNRKIYDLVKAEILKVAAGERESTRFRFSMADLGLVDVTWTSQDLGVALMRDPATGKLTNESWDATRAQLYKVIGYDADVINKFWQILRRDCVLETCWFAGTSDGDEYISTDGEKLPPFEVKFQTPDGGPERLTASNDGTQVYFSPDNYFEISFLVDEQYAQGNDNDTHYKVDTTIMREVTREVAENAMKIIRANAGKSDYEKLKAYKDEICSLVSYDTEAARKGVKASGMDHWNIRYVFDGDPNTNVVCEGYAKAFQFLCNLSTFSGHVKSYLISGQSMGATLNPGAHMWNHVEINGRMWLVDVTNCDGDSPTDDLFLKAPVRQDARQSLRYSFNVGNGFMIGYSDVVNYYGENKNLDILTLDNRNYDPNFYFPIIVKNNVDESVFYGSSRAGNSYWITPGSHSGKKFKEWIGLDGLTLTGNGATPEKLEFIMPAHAVEITVVFEDLPTYTLTLIDAPTDSVKTWQFPAGGTITTTAGWIDGHEFREWEGAEGLTFIEGDKTTSVIKWIMPERDVTLKSYFTPTNHFTDVHENDYFFSPVLWAVGKGITNGTTDTTFSPGRTCTTANIITFLWRANGSPEPSGTNPFSDVNADEYYAKAAVWAYEKGLVFGGSFNGNSLCTRAATMKYLWILAGCPSGGSNPFSDVPADSDSAWAIAWAVAQGVTNGKTDTTFAPDETCTRGQIVTFLYRHYA